MRKTALVHTALITTTISCLAIAGQEYPDYIYVDLGWTDTDCTDCQYTTEQLRTIQYDLFGHLDLASDIEGRLLFRLNNVHTYKGIDEVHVSGWIDAREQGQFDPVPNAHAWTVKQLQDSISMDNQPLSTTEQLSWATAVSDNGHIAGMTGSKDGSTQYTLHKATAWRNMGSRWLQTVSDPHLALSTFDTCEATGDFESFAYGILDFVEGSESDFVITGGSHVGCNTCVSFGNASQYYGLRTYRWSPAWPESADVIASGLWQEGQPLIEHQYALGFLDDMNHAIGQGQILKGWQSQVNNDCAPLGGKGWCHMPTALPTSFDFKGLTSQEHLDFEELVQNSPPGHGHYKYNLGVLRDSFEGHVAGSTKDNIACDDCTGPGSGCDYADLGCNSCYYRAVHWKQTDANGFEPEMLPLLLEDGQRRWDKFHFGHGIGRHGRNLQIVGTCTTTSDASGDTNVAIVWQQNGKNEWLDPIDLNAHLEQGRIGMHGLDPRIDRSSFSLISAHDVNDKGWIVGQARARYCDPLGSGDGDGPDDCICGENRSGDDSTDNAPWDEHRRAFLLIPVTSACETGTSCKGDINNDGYVDSADLGLLLADWQAFEIDPDLNCDGTVDGADLGLLFVNWGPCRPTCP